MTTITITCEICGKTFGGIVRRFPPKYCSDECRYKGQLLHQKRWKRKHLAIKRMKWLVENQQFIDDKPLDDECWVCGSKENLLNHHVKYKPRVVEKTLCKSCHEWLHKALLNSKKCAPKHR